MGVDAKYPASTFCADFDDFPCSLNAIDAVSLGLVCGVTSLLFVGFLFSQVRSTTGLCRLCSPLAYDPHRLPFFVGFLSFKNNPEEMI